MPNSLKNDYQISAAVSQRINILKVWLIIMVVVAHSSIDAVNFTSGNVTLITPAWLDILKYIVTQCIARCSVPAFFFISALLLYRKPYSYKTNLVKKIRSLLIPYLIINTFWIAFYFICQHVPFLSDYFSNPENMVAEWGAAEWLKAYALTQPLPLVYPLWYLKYLFLLNIFAVVFEKVVSKFPKLSFFAFLGIWLMMEESYITQAICYWGMGCAFVYNGWKLEDADKLPKKVVFLLYAAIMTVDTLTLDMVFHGFIHRFCFAFGVVFWYVCTTDFSNEKVLAFLRKFSVYGFSIYLFHEMNASIFKKICIKLFPVSALSQFLQFILVPTVLIICCVILSKLLMRFTPKLYGVITGNRV